MRLGFDLDGTVADLRAALGREARTLFPGVDATSLPSSAAPLGGAAASEEPGAETGAEDRSAVSSLTSRQQRRLWEAVCARPNFWESLDEIEPGALARLYSLTCERRWEVIFLTSRPETAGDTAQAQSHRWLAAQGFSSPSVFIVHGSRGKIAAALQLDVLIDDRPENCLDVAIDSKARPILVWRGEEGKVPDSARQLGIGAVASIKECIDILETLDREGGDQVSMFDRLKRVLGLKSSASRARERQAV